MSRLLPRTPNRIRFSNLIASIALTMIVIGLSACMKSGTNTPASSAASSPAANSANQPSPSTNDSTASVPVAPASTAPVIATADGEKGGTRVEVTELKRLSDNTLSLKFAFVNDSADRFNFGYDYGDPEHSIKDISSVGGITLVDGTNKKKYFVVRDTEDNCVCSRGLRDLSSRSRGNAWAKFPAPPDDVQKISIVIPHFGPIDDVPISR
jgi:hypothetical protein